MELLVLGPIEARMDGREIPLGAAKQRAVLAMLALRANSTVSADELIEGLWGEHPPATAAKMVQQYISQLRRLIAEGQRPGSGHRHARARLRAEDPARRRRCPALRGPGRARRRTPGAHPL